MARAPRWKVYFGDKYLAACHRVEDAAAIVAANGDGTSIRDGHKASRTVWFEGYEGMRANYSYSLVVVAVDNRVCSDAYLDLDECRSYLKRNS